MMENFTILPGDSREILREFPDNYFDSVVTDAPYGLGAEPDAVQVLTDWISKGYHEIKGTGFMGKQWDAFVPQPAQWREVYRVLKPGGHLLSFFGTRTFDWGVISLRIAGFEVRDQIAWTYGEGMPKGLDISRAIDRHLGAVRQGKTVISGGDLFTDPEEIPVGKMWRVGGGNTLNLRQGDARDVFSESKDPATQSAADWSGWNTSLKPAWEPIVVCRKPFPGSVAANVLENGVGALNVDGCRVETKYDTTGSSSISPNAVFGKMKTKNVSGGRGLGRWPANIAHDGTDPVLNAFGGADNNPARFFYCAKATPSDRHAPGVKNTHPTVKPTPLMRWLCRMVTPPGGIVLDPFSGSGSTGKGAILEGFQYVGIELDAEMCEISRLRLADAAKMAAESRKIQPTLF